MSEARATSLEELFERFQRQGDLAALGVVFDRTAPDLLALAVHLVRDPVEAEDLVQATFLAALEGARSFDATRRLEPWLAGILARSAARVHRDRSRTVDPDRLAPRATIDPAHGVEQAELAAELMRGIENLPEPYRRVLEQHLVQGERALDIARASGRAPGTVRMQILRGLERLRRLLPAGLLGVLPPVRVPRGLGALRGEVLARAGLATGAGVASTLAGSTLLGGLLVSSKALVAVVAAAVLALAAFWKLDREPAEPLETVELASAAPIPAEPSALLVPREETEPAEPLLAEAETSADPIRREVAGNTPKTTVAPAPGLWLVGKLGGLDGLRREDTTIAATTFRGPSAKTTGRADGSYMLEITSLVTGNEPPPAVYVTATHPGFASSATGTRRPGHSTVHVTVTHPAPRKASGLLPIPDSVRLAAAQERTELRLDLDLALRTAIVGRVELAEGVHPYGKKVALLAMSAEGPLEVQEEADCDDEDGFELHPASGGDFLLVASNWSVPPVSLRFHAPDQVVTDVGTVRLEPGGVAIEGVLALPFDADVFPFALRARRVSTGEGDGAHEGAEWEGLRIRRGQIDVEHQSAKVRADGVFRISGLAPGTYDLFLEGDQSDYMVVPQPAAKAVPAPSAGVLLGEHFGRVEVVVTGAEERGVAEVRIPLDGGRLSRHVNCGEPFGVIADRRSPLVIEALAPGFSPAKHELPAFSRGVEERVALELQHDVERATLTVEWASSAGAPPPAWVTARLRGSDEQEGLLPVQPGDGECVFRDLEPGRYQVILEPRGSNFWEPLASFLVVAPFEIELAPGETARRTVFWQLGGGVRFVPEVGPGPPEMLDVAARILDASGSDLAVRFITREFEGGTFNFGARTGSVSIHQPSELEPRLLPGNYVLVIQKEGREPRRVPFTVVAGEMVEVPFTLE